MERLLLHTLWESKSNKHKCGESLTTNTFKAARSTSKLSDSGVVQLRCNILPVIHLAGTAENVEMSIRASEKYRDDVVNLDALLVPMDEIVYRVQAAAAKGVIQKKEKRFKD